MKDINEIEKPKFEKWWNEVYRPRLEKIGNMITHEMKVSAHKAWMAKAWDNRNTTESRFKNIINGKGFMIPRVAIKRALQDLFGNLGDAKEPTNQQEEEGKCPNCGERYIRGHRQSY